MATTESTRRQTAATKRSTAAKRAAGTRAQNRTEKTTRTQARRTTRGAQRSAQRTATTAERQATTQANQVQDLVERAALTYVGAALTARDRVVQGYDYLRKTYGDGDSVQRQLKKFERRGSTGRNRFERQLKRSRTRVERELRQRRNQVRREAILPASYLAGRCSTSPPSIVGAASAAPAVFLQRERQERGGLVGGGAPATREVASNGASAEHQAHRRA